jgi:hypothetical protein
MRRGCTGSVNAFEPKIESADFHPTEFLQSGVSPAHLMFVTPERESEVISPHACNVMTCIPIDQSTKSSLPHTTAPLNSMMYALQMKCGIALGTEATLFRRDDIVLRIVICRGI